MVARAGQQPANQADLAGPGRLTRLALSSILRLNHVRYIPRSVPLSIAGVRTRRILTANLPGPAWQRVDGDRHTRGRPNEGEAFHATPHLLHVLRHRPARYRRLL